MRVIDSQGRLLGRWNLIDVAVAVAVVIVVVLGYGAFLLFRTPVPIVASITPTQIFAQQEGTLLVAGEHLRPFLSARLDCGEREEACDSVVTPLLVPSPSSAEVNLTNLSAGTYDFVLLDEARELVRIPEAITVLPLTRSALAEMDIQAVGAFVFLSSADAAAITTGLSLNEELDLLDLEGRLNNVRLDALNARHLRRQLTGEPDIDGPMGRVLAIKPAEPGTQLLRVSEGDLELMESEGLRYMVRDFDTLRQRSVEVANDRLGNTVEALVTGKLQVPAILRLRCLIVAGRCTISGIPALKGALVPLAEWMPEHEKFERSVTHFVFRVDDLRPTTTPPTFVTADVELINAVVRVRFLASSEVAALPRVGDEDARVPVVLDTMVVTARHDGRNPRAAMTAVDAERRQVVTTTEFEGPLAPLRSWEKLGTMQPQRTSFQETMAMFEATLNVPVTQTSAGWQYAGQTVKVGSSFQFEGPTYAMGGWVIDMQLADETRTEN